MVAGNKNTVGSKISEKLLINADLRVVKYSPDPHQLKVQHCGSYSR